MLTRACVCAWPSGVEVERILEVWHTKSFGLRRFTESEPCT